MYVNRIFSEYNKIKTCFDHLYNDLKEICSKYRLYDFKGDIT